MNQQAHKEALPQPQLWKYKVSPVFSIEAPMDMKLTTSLEWREMRTLLTGVNLVLGWMQHVKKGEFSQKSPELFEREPLYNNQKDQNNKLWGRNAIIHLL